MTALLYYLILNLSSSSNILLLYFLLTTFFFLEKYLICFRDMGIHENIIFVLNFIDLLKDPVSL